MSGNDYQSVEVTFLTRTDKAVLVESDGYEECWIPLSTLRDPSQLDRCVRNHRFTLSAQEWILRKHELI